MSKSTPDTNATDHPKHFGTKFLGLIIGMVLAVIYTILQFFVNPILTPTVLYNIALVWAFFVLVIPLILFLAEILWRFFHNYSEKAFPFTEALPMKFWKIKMLSLVRV
jgi:heme/copper-type cytochrome/quinol oxidase subunit 4